MILFILNILVLIHRHATFGDMLGPANLIFHRLEDCDDSDNSIYATVYKRIFNRTTYVLDIDLTSAFVLGDDTEVELKGSMYKDGGWKPGTFYMKRVNVCESLKQLIGTQFTEVLEDVGVEDCPLPAGAYHLKNYIINNDNFKVPKMYGSHRTEVTITYKNELQACFIAYYDFEPKNKLL